MGRWAAGFDGERVFEFEGPEGKVVPVAAEVAHGAVAEIPPAVPLGAGVVDFVEGAHGRGADPEVPVEAFRNGHGFFGAFGDEDAIAVLLGVFLALPAPGTADPDMGFLDGADGAGLDQFNDAAVVLGGVDLDAHLGRRAGFLGGETDLACFVDVVGEGFFAVDVLLMLQGTHGRQGMGMLAGADDDGVEVLGAVEELAEVGELLCFGEFLGGLFDGRPVDVAEGDDVLGTDAASIAASAATGADDGDVEFVVEVSSPDDARGDEECGGSGRGQLVEAAAGDLVLALFGNGAGWMTHGVNSAGVIEWETWPVTVDISKRVAQECVSWSVLVGATVSGCLADGTAERACYLCWPIVTLWSGGCKRWGDWWGLVVGTWGCLTRGRWKYGSCPRLRFGLVWRLLAGDVDGAEIGGDAIEAAADPGDGFEGAFELGGKGFAFHGHGDGLFVEVDDDLDLGDFVGLDVGGGRLRCLAAP